MDVKSHAMAGFAEPQPTLTPPPTPVLILGPTAGGKSELAVRLAEGLAARAGKPVAQVAEILGADSMQIYRGLDAGVAKPSPSQRARAPHHLIDFVEPTQRYTVYDWLEQAQDRIAELQARGVTPIVVGGTNLYIKALLEGLFQGPAMDPALRARLDAQPLPELHAKLQAIDPQAAARIHVNDRKRLVRALEVFEQTGQPMSAWQTQWDDADASDVQPSRDREGAIALDVALHETPTPPLPHGRGSAEPAPRFLQIGLDWPKDLINQRINLRVKAMFFPSQVPPELAAEVTPSGESLPDETRRLEAAGLLGPQAREALGYKQVLAHLRGECSLDEAFERTKILTRRFAKQQRTWLRRFRDVHWLPAAGVDPADLATQALALALAGPA